METAGNLLLIAAAYRHAFMNDLQVISGWLQLGEPGRAAAYIDIVRDSLFGETRMVRAAREEVAALLLGKRGVAEACGVDIAFDAPAGASAFGWDRPETAELVDVLIDAALRLLARLRSKEDKRLAVILREEPHRWGVLLRLDGCPIAPDALLAEVEGLLAESGAAFDVQAALHGLASAGGSWEVGAAGEAAAIVLHWPKPAGARLCS